MSNETVITVQGNLTADPELRYTPSGVAVANFTIASTPRFFDTQTTEWRDGDTLFLRCTAWRDTAERVSQALAKGTRVIAIGELRQRAYQDRDGNNRVSVELEVDDIGSSIRGRANITAPVRPSPSDQQWPSSASDDSPF